MVGTDFGTASEQYERGRPGYGADAVAWLLEDVAGPVVDLGAGTGKLTASIVAAGRDVVAVDPDADMLAALRRTVPDVPAVVGTAERLPLEDSSVGAVLVAQAWHWFDAATASREAARVLRPGGTLGLIWNVRDERAPWVKAMTEILHGSAAEDLVAAGGPERASPFSAWESRQWEWSRAMTRADFAAMAESRSYWIAASDEQRQQIRRGLDSLLDDVIGRDLAASVELPYVTRAFRARLADHG